MVTDKALNDSFERMSATALKVKRERDELLIALKTAKNEIEYLRAMYMPFDEPSRIMDSINEVIERVERR